MLLIQPHIFKHQGDRWIISSQSEVLNNNQTLEGKYYIQEESPKTGAYWMESGVNFTRVKITNTKEIKPNKNMIHVNSMHYYIPRISVVRLNNSMNNQSNCYHSSNQLELIGSYIIPGTQFYTVTAYQNPDVIRIKINNNPFAKGFRNRQDTDDFNDLTVLSVFCHLFSFRMFSPSDNSFSRQ
ncbi:t-box protein-related [Schistosoma mansoni]|uniref:t-box protein-related n=1 Tax=Schistosoma mansoni TaxID=6183 RepID=UPI0001A62397|nr:t-box protein-related [Schistosoma mansoni]|eukprot:XP_018653438.1 t-box protein-related [Schistosoma mansoni]